MTMGSLGDIKAPEAAGAIVGSRREVRDATMTSGRFRNIQPSPAAAGAAVGATTTSPAAGAAVVTEAKMPDLIGALGAQQILQARDTAVSEAGAPATRSGRVQAWI